MKIDLEKTRHYYETNPSFCDCDACQNYVFSISDSYPNMKSYLQSIGVEITKPFETMWVENSIDQSIHYVAVQYIVFGRWEHNSRVIIDSQEFYQTNTHPNTKIIDEHYVLEVSNIRLPWKLKKAFSEAFPTQKHFVE